MLDDARGTTGSVASKAGGRAADLLVSRLEARINSGEWAEGSHLPAERDLMSDYGISRTVVREAIARLASRGLIENRPRFRPVVRKPGYDAALGALGGIVNRLLNDKGGVKNLYDVRIFLEASLVRNAAVNARRRDIEALRAALEENRKAIPDSDAFYATDIAFHGVLYEVTCNPIFPAMHKAFTSWLSEHWEKMLRSPERNRVNYASHLAIYTAIVERDPDVAEQALRSHLNAAWEYVRGTFNTD